MSNTSRVLSFEESWLASKARKRIELVLAPPSKRGSVELPSSVAPPTATEHAMIEAAIQLDLITPEQAEVLVEKGKTLNAWIMEQKSVELSEPREGKQIRKLDWLWLVTLLLFNLVVWAGFGWIVLRVLKSL